MKPDVGPVHWCTLKSIFYTKLLEPRNSTTAFNIFLVIFGSIFWLEIDFNWNDNNSYAHNRKRNLGVFVFNERTKHSNSVRIFVIHRVTIFIRLMSVVNKFRAILVDLESQCVLVVVVVIIVIVGSISLLVGSTETSIYSVCIQCAHTKHTLLYSIWPLDMIYAHIMRSCLWIFGNLAAPLPASQPCHNQYKMWSILFRKPQCEH